jgi:hypothetical protein
MRIEPGKEREEIGSIKGSFSPTKALFRTSSGTPVIALAVWVLFVFTLCVSELAFSQSAAECVDAASLWLPPDRASEEVVTKWNKDLTFSIISHEKDIAAVKLVEATLNSLSHKMGLKIVEIGQSNEATLPDLLVVVDPNVSNDALLLRELALKFFQSRFGRAGRFQIDADAWNAKLRSLSPKCGGLDVEVNHAKDVSFIVVQEDATPACVSVGLGQSLGMIGVKNYYTSNGEKVPQAVLEEAMRGLYSPEIRVGMKRAGAIEHLKEACKQ